MFDKIKHLKTLGYTPSLILDIGAYHGHWTQEMKLIYPNSHYCLFEANNYKELKKYDDDKNVTVYDSVILHDKIKEVDWYLLNGTGDSIYKEETRFYSDVLPIKRITNTIDNLLKENNFSNIFIKIDCQGSEIPILNGSTSILDKTDFIVLEMPLFGEYNKGVPNFLGHIKYMDTIGFIPFDILEDHYINGFNMQIDMIFINKKHNFNELVKNLLK